MLAGKQIEEKHMLNQLPGDSKDMRTLIEALTDESHIVREGEAGRVTLTAFGWCVVVILGTLFGLITAVVSVWSVR
jgi:hypothetical protein